MLSERHRITHDVILVVFSLPDSRRALGLSTCACILAKFDAEGSNDTVVRPYTPVSTNALMGKFQLILKVYRGGQMSQHLNTLQIGSEVSFKHVALNVKVQYPFGRKHLTMIVGGTGITPMIQALHAVLGTPEDSTKVSLIYGNKTQEDIICKDLLADWSRKSGGRLKVTHVLSQAEDDESWGGLHGYITRDVIRKHSAPPDDVLVMVCGPPPMYQSLCGPRDQKEMTGLLAQMGYKAEQVFKF